MTYWLHIGFGWIPFLDTHTNASAMLSFCFKRTTIKIYVLCFRNNPPKLTWSKGRNQSCRTLRSVQGLDHLDSSHWSSAFHGTTQSPLQGQIDERFQSGCSPGLCEWPYESVCTHHQSMAWISLRPPNVAIQISTKSSCHHWQWSLPPSAFWTKPSSMEAKPNFVEEPQREIEPLLSSRPWWHHIHCHCPYSHPMRRQEKRPCQKLPNHRSLQKSKEVLEPKSLTCHSHNKFTNKPCIISNCTLIALHFFGHTTKSLSRKGLLCFAQTLDQKLNCFQTTIFHTFAITYGPHKAVAEVSNHNEPIGRKSGIQLVRNPWTSHSIVLFWTD